MKLEEMRKLSLEELKCRVVNWKADLLKEFVTAGRNKKAKYPHKFPQLKKQIARAYTLLREKGGR